MAVFHQHLKLGLKLREALAWIGAMAQAEGNAEGATRAQELVNALPEDAEVTVDVPVVNGLVHAIDEYRAKGQTDVVEKIDELIKALKGPQQRVITGVLHFGARTPGEASKAIEQLHDTLVKKP